MIRFSQPGALNDPYEVSVVFESMIPPECIPPFVAHLDEVGELDSAREEGIKRGMNEALEELAALGMPVHLFDRTALRSLALSQFEQLGGESWLKDAAAKVFGDITSLGQPEFKKIVTDRYRAKINENVGVLCLSETWNALLMWSHYAVVHTGIVLGFDSEDYYFRQADVTVLPTEIRPITYCDEIPRFEGFDPLGEPEQLLRLGDPFFYKGPEWAYEREWRLLRPLDAATTIIPGEPYPIHLMRFPEYVLQEVVIGAKASDETRAAVMAAVGDYCLDHVAVYEARFPEGKRGLDRVLIRPPTADPFWRDRV